MSKIVDIARSYIGQKEISGNQGFIDKDFDAKMRTVGFVNGYAWCAIFGHLVYKEALPADIYAKVKSLFSASALGTLNNFRNAGYQISQTPIVGSLVIWQHGNGFTGHVGICSKVIDNKNFCSIEGNTDSKGGREGIEVAEKTRKVVTGTSGLNLKGFITI